MPTSSITHWWEVSWRTSGTVLATSSSLQISSSTSHFYYAWQHLRWCPLVPLSKHVSKKLIQISLVVWGCYCIQTNLDSKIPLACWYGNANGFYFQHASVITKSYIILLGCVVLLYSQGLSNWCFHHRSFFSLAEPEFIHETKPGDYGSKSSVTSGNKAKVSMMCNWGCEHLATAVVFHF